jgi:hypothetical protein
VQKTAALGSKVVGLFSAFGMVFPSFSAWIPVSSDKLLANRKNLVIDGVALFEEAQAFQKLLVRIRKTLCAKVVRWIAVVGHFPALWLIFVIFLAFGWPSFDVGFGQTWYFLKACDVYFAMAQILYHSEFQLRNCGLRNYSCRRGFLVGGLFSDADFGQLRYAFNETKEPTSR